MKDKLMPADIYTIVNQTVLTEIDKKILISLYQPIIGAEAVSLYLTMWTDLDKSEIISSDFTHHHLMVVLKSRLDKIEESRKSLEAVGLLKSYIKRNDNINEYLYELYSPLSANEFFNNPILNVVLLNNIGEEEYNILLTSYKKRSIRKTGFEEITATLNETYKSIPSTSLEEIRKVEKEGLNMNSNIDFEFIEKSIPAGLVTNKTFNKKIKETITQLSFVYNIDTTKMIEIIRMSIEDIGVIDKEKLISNARKNYEYNNNGRLPTIVYNKQPEYLKTPAGDTSDKGKLITYLENKSPYDFLKAKNKGANPSKYDLQTLEILAVNYELPAGVINLLVDYVLRVNDNKLYRNFIEEIASTFKRSDIKTVPAAMEKLIEENKKRNKAKSSKTSKDAKTSTTSKQTSKVPSWINSDIQSMTMTEEELKELEEDMKGYK